MIVQGKLSAVFVRRHIEALKITDFGNRLQITPIEEQAVSLSLDRPINFISSDNISTTYKLRNGLSRPIAIDNLAEEYRCFFHSPYTELYVVHEVRDTSNITEEEENFYDQIIKIFIDSYRIISKDVRVPQFPNFGQDRLIIQQCSIEYSAEEINEPVLGRLTRHRKLDLGLKLLIVADWTESGPASQVEINLFSSKLKKILDQSSSVFQEEYWLLKAYEELVIRKNAKYALLEAFIGAESAIRSALRFKKLSKGVSKNKLDSYESEVGIGYLINVELPMLLEDINTSERELLGEVDRIRKLRNNVMHGASEVSEEDAGRAINVIHRLIKLFYSRELI